jgi:hypothetical protein
MSDLEPLSVELKRQLDAAEGAWPAPPPELADRLLPNLRTAWAAHAAVLPPGGAPMPATAAKRLFGSVGALSTAAALVVGAVGGAALHAVMSDHPTIAPAPAPVPPPVEAPPAPPVAAEPAAPERVAPEPVAPKPIARPRAAVPPLTAAPVSSLAAEQNLLDGARTAVLRGEPQLALPLLEQYRREHPRGALAEEHAALEVQALALAGRRDEAVAAAKRFHAAWPDSMFAESVDLALSEMNP